ncbi:MAG: ribosome-associated translation inhibitor RaiA [Candidatus Yanofskybacteria bacterium]|nr:ribosome-associated translation inhibitor RaiA [Candidatus Yanofskybacteria bacterium]
MKIMIHSKNLELTPSIETFVNQKMDTIAKLFKPGEQLTEARIEIGKPSKHHQKGLVYYAEINLKIAGKLLRATVEHVDLRTAIDFARDEVERQIKKFKSKIRDTSRKPKRT